MGGSTKSSTTVPKYQQDAAIAALGRANQVANIGYAPYYGPDVAALAPQQIAAMQGTNQAASAFGMPTTDLMAGMPAAQNFNGVQAYSSGGLYDQAVAELQRRNPDQYNAIMAQFNPVGVNASAASVPTPVQESRDRSSNDRSTPAPARASTSTGGFISLRDMFDGGGAGKSGGAFKGGPLSSIINTTSVKPSTAKPASRSSSSSSSKAKNTSIGKGR